MLKYFAKDCATSFPNVTSGPAQGLGDLVCDSRYSDIEPSSGGEVACPFLNFFDRSYTFFGGWGGGWLMWFIYTNTVYIVFIGT